MVTRRPPDHLFASRDANEELYLMEAEGENLRRLTNHPAVDKASSWSLDGRFRICVFGGNRRGKETDEEKKKGTN